MIGRYESHEFVIPVARSVSKTRYCFLSQTDPHPERNGLSLLCAGREHCLPGYHVSSSKQSCISVEFISEGRGTLRIGDDTHDLVPGTMFTYDTDSDYEIRSDSEAPMTKYFVAYRVITRDPLLSFLPGQVSWSSDILAIQKLYEQLIEEGRRSGALHEELTVRYLELILLKAVETRSNRAAVKSSGLETYRRVIGCIESHFPELSTLSEVSAMVGVGSNHICRLFSQFSEETPNQCLTRHKMNRAAELLVTQHTSIKEIARAVGYEDPSYFSRVFTKRFGRSPNKFREARESGAAVSNILPASEASLSTDASHDARMQWWREARLGMMIHWGLYSVAAGEWSGRRIPGFGEWIMSTANISAADYASLTSQFNASKYSPSDWVRVAKDAGMKYLVMSAKHHDGFCLFKTGTTKWNIVDSTPFGKDALTPLAEECRKQDIEFGIAYSIMDWHHSSQQYTYDGRRTRTQLHPKMKDDYLAYMKRQLSELIDACDPAILWFNGEWVDWWTESDGRELYSYLREQKDSLIINNRIGRGRRQGLHWLSEEDKEYTGDFCTPQEKVPVTGVPGIDWEASLTMNDTWGYKRIDDRWKSTKTLIHNVIDAVSKGGSFLLNVGPTGDGTIPAASLERLANIGEWMSKYGEAIYGCEASSTDPPNWGRYTMKQDGENTTLYAHVLEWPSDNAITVPWEGETVPGCTIANNATELEARREGDSVTIDLPPTPPDSIATVIRIDDAE